MIFSKYRGTKNNEARVRDWDNGTSTAHAQGFFFLWFVLFFPAVLTRFPEDSCVEIAWR